MTSAFIITFLLSPSSKTNNLHCINWNKGSFLPKLHLADSIRHPRRASQFTSLRKSQFSELTAWPRLFTNSKEGVCGKRMNPSVGMSARTDRSLRQSNNSEMPTVVKENEQESLIILPEEGLNFDTYNGITIKVSQLPIDMLNSPKLFKIALENSIKKWKEQNYRGIWIHLPTRFSSLVEVCTEIGFDFHNAKAGLLIMTKWLPEGLNSRLPFGPTHQVGVGAVVLHPTNGKMLVVQEKSGPAAAEKLWKMVTGLVDPGENLVDASVRELKEETGLDGVFDRILSFRQTHGGIFDHSDMFFVCLLTLDSKYIECLRRNEEIELIPQASEIENISWMEADDYANQERWQASPLYQEINRIITDVAKKSKKKDGCKEDQSCRSSGDGGFIAKSLPVGFRPGYNTVFVSKT